MLRALGPLLLAAQITAPRIGFLRDGHGRLRPVFGVSGNFILGDPVLDGVISAASTGRVTLAKTADSLLLLDEDARVLRRWPAPPGPALFAFTREAAVVHFLETGECFQVEGGPAACPQALTLPDGTLLERSGEELLIRYAGGGDRRVPLPAAVLEPLGEAWVAIATPGGRFALRLADAALSRLPEAGP